MVRQSVRSMPRWVLVSAAVSRGLTPVSAVIRLEPEAYQMGVGSWCPIHGSGSTSTCARHWTAAISESW